MGSPVTGMLDQIVSLLEHWFWEPVIVSSSSHSHWWRLGLISAIYSVRALSPLCSGKPNLLGGIFGHRNMDDSASTIMWHVSLHNPGFAVTK